MTNIQKRAKRTRFLFGLWCAFYIIFEISSSIYVSYQQVINGTDPTGFLSGFQLITLAAVSFVFLPSLYGIYRSTKKYDSKKLNKVVRWLLLIMSVWTGMMIICTIIELIMPGIIS